MKILVILCSILAVAISEPPVRRGPQYFTVPPLQPASSSPIVPLLTYGVPNQMYLPGPPPTQATAKFGQPAFFVSNNAIQSSNGNNEPITFSDLIGSHQGSLPTPVYGMPFNSGLSTQSFVVPNQISFGVPNQSYGPPATTFRNNAGKSNRRPTPASNSLKNGKRPSTQSNLPYASAAPAVISRPNNEYGPQIFNSGPTISTNALLPQPSPQVITIPPISPTVFKSDSYITKSSPSGFSSSSHFPSIESGNTGSSGYGGKGNDYDESKSLPANYEFEYTITDQKSGNDYGHREARQQDSTQGRYFVQLPDGRRQVVEYEADHNGYRPKVTYGEANFNTNTGYGQEHGTSQNNAASSNQYIGPAPPPITIEYKPNEITTSNNNYGGYIY